MPGIAGIISKRSAMECESDATIMVERMNHEPTYVTGTHFIPEMGFYAGWTAMKGSFAANQVFKNERGDIELLLAGECFLAADEFLRLKEKGHRVRTDHGSWLLHLYEERAETFFQNLN